MASWRLTNTAMVTKAMTSKAVAGEEIAERDAEDALVVQRVGIERQHDHGQHERQQAGQHLHLGVPPVGLALVPLDHDRALLASCGNPQRSSGCRPQGRLAPIRGSTVAVGATRVRMLAAPRTCGALRLSASRASDISQCRQKAARFQRGWPDRSRSGGSPAPTCCRAWGGTLGRHGDYRFIIVDDHPLFRGALSQALSAAFENAEVLEAGSLDELTERLATAGDIDLILLDLTMPGVHGVSGLLYLRAQHPEVPVVIVSASDDAGHHPPVPRLRRLGLHPQVAAGRAHPRRDPQDHRRRGVAAARRRPEQRADRREQRSWYRGCPR